MSDRQLFRQLAINFMMGAVLGVIFVAVLLIVDPRHGLDVIVHSEAPVTSLFVLVSGVSAYFAFGAAITHFHFLVMDDGKS